MKTLGKVLAFPIKVIARVIGMLFSLALIAAFLAGAVAAVALVVAAIIAAAAFAIVVGLLLVAGLLVSAPLRRVIRTLDPSVAVEEDSVRVAVRKIMEAAQ
jgi:hypothetical protein